MPIKLIRIASIQLTIGISVISIFKAPQLYAQNTEVESYLDAGCEAVEQADIMKAVRLFQSAVDACNSEADGGLLHAQSLSFLAIILNEQGNFGQAEVVIRRALAIVEGHAELEAASFVYVDVLARIKRRAGKPDEAEALENKSKELQQAFSKKPSGVIVAVLTLVQFAKLYGALGHHSDAEPLLRLGLVVSKVQLGDDHIYTGVCNLLIAQSLSAQSRHEIAVPFYLAAQAIFQKTKGEGELQSITATEGLAVSLNSLGRVQQAEALLRKTIARRKELQGKESPEVAKGLFLLSATLIAQNKFEDAMDHARQAMEIVLKTYGPKHLIAAIYMKHYGVLCHSAGKLDVAQDYLERSLAIHEQQLGADAPAVADILSSLALVSEFNDNGSVKDFLHGSERTRMLWERVVAIQEKALGQDHPDTRQALEFLAHCYSFGFKPDVQVKVRKRLVESDERISNVSADVRCKHLSSLVSALGQQKKYSEAEPYAELAIRIQEAAFGRDYQKLPTSLSQLAWIYCEQGKYTLAEPLYKRSLQLFEKLTSADVMETIEQTQIMTTYATLLRKLKRVEEANKLELQIESIRKRVRDQ
ncbi:MAG: tetratricopeptide repeat protein [Planctomycetota bacterium]